MSSTKENIELHEPGVRLAETFESFYAREWRGLVGVAVALTGRRDVAEELVQDAMLVANARWADVREMDNPTAWVRRVVANRSVSLVRRRITETRMLLRVASERRTPVQTLELGADSEHLWRLVRQLPRRQAQVLTLRVVSQLSLQEIGDVLGISKETAQVHLDRARSKLQAQLTKGSNDDHD